MMVDSVETQMLNPLGIYGALFPVSSRSIASFSCTPLPPSLSFRHYRHSPPPPHTHTHLHPQLRLTFCSLISEDEFNAAQQSAISRRQIKFYSIAHEVVAVDDDVVYVVAAAAAAEREDEAWCFSDDFLRQLDFYFYI